jgi:quinol monooxygenase YgiN
MLDFAAETGVATNRGAPNVEGSPGPNADRSENPLHALTGYLDFRPEEHEETVAALNVVTARSRRDAGCIDYWWSEDLEHPCRFRFFECWDSEEAFNAHQVQPYEQEFMTDHVSRIIGADAHVLAIADRSSALGR